jgi:hypothetical protein
VACFLLKRKHSHKGRAVQVIYDEGGIKGNFFFQEKKVTLDLWVPFQSICISRYICMRQPLQARGQIKKTRNWGTIDMVKVWSVSEIYVVRATIEENKRLNWIMVSSFLRKKYCACLPASTCRIMWDRLQDIEVHHSSQMGQVWLKLSSQGVCG